MGLSSLIKIIETAARGEEVRDALVKALTSVNEAQEQANQSIYTLTIEGTKLKLTDANGKEQEVDIGVVQNTTYTMTLEGTTLKLTDSAGGVQSVNVVADTTELEKKVKKNSDRLGGLSFSLTSEGLLHIEKEENM